MNFEMIAPKQLDTYVRDKSAFIIDLRTPDEFVERHIKGAVNIPYENLGNCYTLPQDMMIIVYCERGSISMAAARELAEKGYHVKTMIGGIHAYCGRYLESYRHTL